MSLSAIRMVISNCNTLLIERLSRLFYFEQTNLNRIKILIFLKLLKEIFDEEIHCSSIFIVFFFLTLMKEKIEIRAL